MSLEIFPSTCVRFEIFLFRFLWRLDSIFSVTLIVFHFQIYQILKCFFRIWMNFAVIVCFFSDLLLISSSQKDLSQNYSTWLCLLFAISVYRLLLLFCRKEIVDDVWLTSDSTRGRWRTAHVTYSSPYRHAFVFEALPDTARLQYRGHVAVDDIVFTDGPCQSKPFILHR